MFGTIIDKSYVFADPPRKSTYDVLAAAGKVFTAATVVERRAARSERRMAGFCPHADLHRLRRYIERREVQRVRAVTNVPKLQVSRLIGTRAQHMPTRRRRDGNTNEWLPGGPAFVL